MGVVGTSAPWCRPLGSWPLMVADRSRRGNSEQKRSVPAHKGPGRGAQGKGRSEAEPRPLPTYCVGMGGGALGEKSLALLLQDLRRQALPRVPFSVTACPPQRYRVSH